MPQGFQIPEKPLPKTEEECLAELAAVRKKEMEAYRACTSGMPPGPELESKGLHMVMLRERRVRLQCALRDGKYARRKRK